MPEPRYSVPGIPQQESNGLTAFMPHFNRHAGGGYQQYKYDVTGRPGTEAIPAPTVDTQISPDQGDKAQMGFARSSDAPPVWFPNQYYQRVIAEPPGAGMPIYLPGDSIPDGSGDVLPIPAVDVALHLRTGQAMSPPTGVVQRVRQLPWFPRLYTAPPG